jgi:gamma-glutamyl:cysteine ligase YbdK (ATP-grasp superfamily)
MIQKINPKKGIQSGIELEGNLIDENGRLSNQSDYIIQDPKNYGFITPEPSHTVCEVVSDPSESLDGLNNDIRDKLSILQGLTDQYGLRFIPSSTLHNDTPIKTREAIKPRSKKLRIILGGGKKDLTHHLTGTHIHTELLEDPDQAYSQLLALTAMDPTFAFMSTSPFFFGKNSKNSYRPQVYRNEVFENFPLQGQLLDYPNSVEEAYERQRESFLQFKKILESRGLDTEGFTEDNCIWGPLRVTPFGTIESRCADANLPSNALALAALYKGVSQFIESENPTIKIDRNKEHSPQEYFTPKNNRLVLPNYDTLKYFEASGIATGIKNPQLKNYLTNIVETASKGLEDLKHIQPFIKMLEEETNFADEIIAYASKHGLEKGHRINSLGARKLRQHIADCYERDLKN